MTIFQLFYLWNLCFCFYCFFENRPAIVSGSLGTMWSRFVLKHCVYRMILSHGPRNDNNRKDNSNNNNNNNNNNNKQASSSMPCPTIAPRDSHNPFIPHSDDIYRALISNFPNTHMFY